MPAYDYRCPKCEHIWEISTPAEFRDQLDLQCPACNVKLVRKITLPMALVWSGKFHDRWYQIHDNDGLGPTW